MTLSGESHAFSQIGPCTHTHAHTHTHKVVKDKIQYAHVQGGRSRYRLVIKVRLFLCIVNRAKLKP